MKRNLFLAVMFTASVALAEIDWSNANNITITTEAELRELARKTNLGERNGFENVTFTLANDIDLNGCDINQWIPIGNSTNQFSGTFDGGNNVIRGVFINMPDGEQQGLFGNSFGAIRNLGVYVNIIGRSRIGGVVARNFGSIQNVYSSGNITIIGLPAVATWGAGGGLTGENSGFIQNSFSRTNIDRLDNNMARAIGGLVGGNFGLISNSYAFGDIGEHSGINSVGGLVGYNSSSGSTGRITNSFAKRRRSNDRLIGINSGTAANSALKAAEELRTEDTFESWDFNTIWGIHPDINNGFPYLRSLAKTYAVDVAVVWDETEITFNGNEHKPTATATTASGEPLPLTISGATNAGRHTAIAEIANPELALLFNLTNAEMEFEIKPADISRAIVLANSRQYTGEPITTVVSVRLGRDYLEENEDYLVVYSDSVNIGEVTVTITGIVNYSGTATGTFLISAANPINVPVIWENLGPFTFNGVPQGPTPIAITDNGDTLELIPRTGYFSEAGPHTAWAQLVRQDPARPVNLTGDILQNYEILRRPITVLLEADQNAGVNSISGGAEKDTIVVIPGLFADSNNLKNIILGLVDFDNFVGDDDISVFGSARPTVRIIDPEAEIEESSRFGRSDDLVRYRLYLLRIETEGMLAENYQIGATEFFIRTEEFLPSFIRQNTSRDSRYGIILENAVVSDFARISVITPEQATVNLAIFDNLGNVVFSADDVRAGFKPALTADGAIVWDLQNFNGRFVANGTYLIIAEATTINGRRYLYSARIGVNR